MLVPYLITICLFFLMVSGAPVGRKAPVKTTSTIKPTSTIKDTAKIVITANQTELHNILLPDSFQLEKNYELFGGGVEGDMIFHNGFHPSKPGQDRGVAIAGPHPWPGNTIPYDLSQIPSVSHRDFIVQAMRTLMFSVGTPIPGQTSRTPCVLFRPRTATDRNFLTITYGSGCSGTVGFFPGTDMKVTLANPGCFTSGIIQHELLHVLGFYHEQSRPDRDSYVAVYYNNMQQGTEYNFDKYVWGSQVLNQNTPYDLQSIMHYAPYSFSKNGQPTILPLRYGVSIGQRQQLSPTDIAEIRDYYHC